MIAELTTGETAGACLFHQSSRSDIIGSTRSTGGAMWLPTRTRMVSILAGCSLVHHFARHDPMQLENFRMRDLSALRVLFHETQSGKIIRHLAAGTLGRRGDFAPFFDGADLFEGEGITLDGGGGMGVANPGVFLQSRDPRHLNRGRLDAFTQSGDLLDQARAEQG